MTTVGAVEVEKALRATEGEAGHGAGSAASPSITIDEEPAVARGRQLVTPVTASSFSSARGLGWTVVAWVVATVLAAAVVCYGFGPLFQQRDQRSLMMAYRTAIYDASVAVVGPGQQVAVPLPPTPGTPVGILEIGAIGLQQVVVEGVAPSQTESGPGHVPGTAGLGQPGNAVVVARRTLWWPVRPPRIAQKWRRNTGHDDAGSELVPRERRSGRHAVPGRRRAGCKRRFSKCRKWILTADVAYGPVCTSPQ